MTYYKLNKPDVSAEYFDNEVLAINLKTGYYHSLKGTAVTFWRLLLEGNSVENSIGKIAKIYSVDSVIAQVDFNKFISELLENNLIVATSDKVEGVEAGLLNNSAVEYNKPMLEVYTDMADLVHMY